MRLLAQGAVVALKVAPCRATHVSRNASCWIVARHCYSRTVQSIVCGSHSTLRRAWWLRAHGSSVPDPDDAQNFAALLAISKEVERAVEYPARDAVASIRDSGIQGRCNQKPLLPPQAPCLHGRKTLVMDLDQCLIHTVQDQVAAKYFAEQRFDYDYSLRLGFGAEDEAAAAKRPPNVQGFVRPHALAFLKQVAQSFEVVLWTAGSQPYGSALAKFLDPDGAIFQHVLGRDKCLQLDQWGFSFAKDLAALGRDLAGTVIVDDNPLSYALQLSNAIPMAPFVGPRRDSVSGRESPPDNALLETLPLLRELCAAADVRAVLHKRFRLADLLSREFIDKEREASLAT